jgi:hypothetical protein
LGLILPEAYSLTSSVVLKRPVAAASSKASEGGAGRYLLRAPGDADIARMIGAMRPSIGLTLQRLQAEGIIVMTHDLAALRREVGD